ncbi:MAG: MBOAT family protein [Bacteroidaceae bacterium]|nr:MBOAT family protein [Bacteroidaceae bacterium]
MVVNSINFWLFFAIVLIPYFLFFKRKEGQNLWLLAASYIFYGWADWKILPLLVAVTGVFYALGLAIERHNHSRPRLASQLTTVGVVLGIGILFYFKYFGFFVEEMSALFAAFGLPHCSRTLNIVMPIGISFFTFKLMGYVIEVHRESIRPTRDVVEFATFIAFFPTILSGPIDRASTFLPQLGQRRRFSESDFTEGLKRVLWGMFLKMCIADVISPWTDAVFGNYAHHNATTILVAAVLYLLQLYTDFCGFSEMAIGVAQVMGLRVAENFNRPFMAKNVAEYWRRWHISLTTWITDYVFMPLNVGLRHWGKWGLYVATLVNLVVIGIWHGANWTYFWFGVYHGLLLVATTALDKPRKRFEKRHRLKDNELYAWSRRLLTFTLFAFGSVLFRSASVHDFLGTLSRIPHGFGPLYSEEFSTIVVYALPSIAILFLREWSAEYRRNVHFLHARRTWVRLFSIALLICYILYCGQLEGQSFIYFQF